MYLLAEEKETHISHTQVENDMWTVYTTEMKIMRKIERMGIVANKIDKDSEGSIIAKSYNIPYKQIQFVKERKKPEITEERRKQLKENISKLQEMRRTKQLNKE